MGYLGQDYFGTDFHLGLPEPFFTSKRSDAQEFLAPSGALLSLVASN
jgi:hypothetical protein